MMKPRYLRSQVSDHCRQHGRLETPGLGTEQFGSHLKMGRRLSDLDDPDERTVGELHQFAGRGRSCVQCLYGDIVEQPRGRASEKPVPTSSGLPRKVSPTVYAHGGCI